MRTSSFDTVDITPTDRVELAGFSGRHRIWEGVHSRLEANLALIRDGTASHLIVSVDLLYSGLLGSMIAERLGDTLTPNDITVFVSHTHFAPATETALPFLGDVDGQYLARIADLIAASARRCASSTNGPYTLIHTAGRSNATAGRRRRAWVIDRSVGAPLLSRRQWRRPVLPPASATTAHVMWVTDGRSEAVIWSYGCHPSEMPHGSFISAEYPGVVRDRIRAIAGQPDLPVLFLQGFAGDLRPAIVSWWRGQTRAGRIENVLNRGRGFRQSDGRAWTVWSDGLADEIERIATSPIRIAEPMHLHVETRSLPASDLYSGAPSIDLDIRLLHLSNGISILALPGEPTSDLLRFVPDYRSGARAIIPAGYAGRSLGYVPGPRVAAEGGYEAGDFFGLFGVDWQLDPDVPARLIAVIENLVSSDRIKAR